jgi:hypothetical protein
MIAGMAGDSWMMASSTVEMADRAGNKVVGFAIGGGRG